MIAAPSWLPAVALRYLVNRCFRPWSTGGASELRSRAERVTWARLAIFAHWDNEKCSSEARSEYEPGRLTRKPAPGRT